MRYPIAIESGDEKHAYGVVVPDLPGCFSAGDTLDEAIVNAEEAILLFLEESFDAGKPLPQPSKVEALRGRKEFRGWTWAIASVDLSKLSKKSQRINISVPDRLLHSIDTYTSKNGETRSGFLTRAAMATIAAEA